MFELLEIHDRTIIKPDELSRDVTIDIVLLLKIKKKFIGKVLLNKGVVTSIKSLIVLNNTIVELEGIINVEYKSEIIIFAPKSHDILYGKITHSDQTGITINCEVCKVFVYAHELPENSTLSLSDNIWGWQLDNGVFYYDIGEEVRVKIESVQYRANSEITLEVSKEGANISDIVKVLGTFKQSGLGPLRWWKA